MMTYFYDTYLEYNWELVHFPIKFWNFYNSFLLIVTRNDNVVEGWHYKMNTSLSGSHPVVRTCLEKLEGEQKFWEDEIVRRRTGLGATKNI